MSRIVSGDGIRVTDSEGNVFIDAVSALWCASLGFTPERLTRAMTAADGAACLLPQLHGPHAGHHRATWPHDWWRGCPGDLGHVFFGTSGSEAVESAAKIARFYQAARGKPGKRASSRGRAPITARVR
jgi:4-aminobutyrate--pyruvate transaminase